MTYQCDISGFRCQLNLSVPATIQPPDLISIPPPLWRVLNCFLLGQSQCVACPCRQLQTTAFQNYTLLNADKAVIWPRDVTITVFAKRNGIGNAVSD